MKIEITRHAEQRMRERLGLNKKSIERMAQRAYESGMHHNETKGNLNKWITSIYFKNKNANNIRIYGNMLYIFCNDILVTVFQIPHRLSKDLENYIRK